MIAGDDPAFAALRSRFPLGAEWGAPNLFAGTATIHGVGVEISGLSAQRRSGEVAYGSAGEVSFAPVSRAYFELLERAAIIDASRSGEREWATWDESRERRGAVGADVVIPESPEPARWRYARSNGVAVATSWAEACCRAQWELQERDQVLRSWRGEILPQRVDVARARLPAAWGESYSFEAYAFGSGHHVMGVFGFPRREEAPLVYGFGARGDRDAALCAAAAECTQRLGFLWGEPISDEEPEFEPTPDYHQNAFLRPSARARLRGWLDGAHAALWVPPPKIEDGPLEPRRFVDLTPSHLAGQLFVAKALRCRELPLIFGIAPGPAGSRLPGPLSLHPIA